MLMNAQTTLIIVTQTLPVLTLSDPLLVPVIVGLQVMELHAQVCYNPCRHFYFISSSFLYIILVLVSVTVFEWPWYNG